MNLVWFLPPLLNWCLLAPIEEKKRFSSDHKQFLPSPITPIDSFIDFAPDTVKVFFPCTTKPLFYRLNILLPFASTKTIRVPNGSLPTEWAWPLFLTSLLPLFLPIAKGSEYNCIKTTLDGDTRRRKRWTKICKRPRGAKKWKIFCMKNGTHKIFFAPPHHILFVAPFPWGSVPIYPFRTWQYSVAVRKWAGKTCTEENLQGTVFPTQTEGKKASERLAVFQHATGIPNLPKVWPSTLSHQTGWVPKW